MSSRSVKMAALAAACATALAAFVGGASAARRKGLVAELQDATGRAVGTVRMVATDDAKVRVSIRAMGLTPGFHGYHVHTAGVCDPQAKDTTGATVPFFSAGGHFNPETSNTHGAHAGDMPPLLATEDGAAVLRFKTDRFRLGDLLDSDGSAIVIHAAPDNLANVPGATPAGGERYHSHVENVFGPDAATKATGDAGARFACGVLERAAR